MAEDDGYCQENIPSSIMTELEAGAFRRLCAHLRDRSDEVQNLDLMTLSGFCRNCLAKWLVVEARGISDKMKSDTPTDKQTQIVHALDALGYDEAAREVYGCGYAEWKKRHAKKATDEQMRLYKESMPMHAKHDKTLLLTRADKPVQAQNIIASKSASTQSEKVGGSLISDVCCQDVDLAHVAPSHNDKTISSASTTLFSLPPVPPVDRDMTLRLGILTVSDRAAANQYSTGDLSGPAVEQSLLQLVKNMNSDSNSSSIHCTVVEKSVVSDSVDQIKDTLIQWCGGNDETSYCDLILTTGGTGFSPRDVTPEATLEVVGDRECRGLMAWASAQCSVVQPLAPLSRGTAGIRGNTLVVNLPGNPGGIPQILQVLFPLLLHALKDIQQGTK
eukprot:CAMPEP_0198301152 /NCGR_PEP_ID=MMETSP1449-20131203/50739_1 /TAXON_ID=420275 /ORGANISM="Attheya septentrionalis, Strain CCMP2084" /LENGTH=388 /DNA_ID=CAMNT_0044003165 /DNA_START=50 /DNA_END=1216 /DNA_ORIENTATION=+